MIAVIQTGGKQYLIKTGETLKVEKLKTPEGGKLSFDKVLLTAKDDGTDVKIGSPFLEGASVEVAVEKQGRSKKIRVVKFKRKTRYHKVHGHRQAYTQIKSS